MSKKFKVVSIYTNNQDTKKTIRKFKKKEKADLHCYKCNDANQFISYIYFVKKKNS